jgi:hypothetical protein
MNKARIFDALGKTVLLSIAWSLLNLTFLDVVFIMFSVDIMTLLIAKQIWGD